MHGVVLAGGDSRRMGRDKAGLRIGGEVLWRRQCRILREAGAERVSLVRRPGQAAPDGAICRRDRTSNCGPLAGLEAAFAPPSDSLVAVLAVDMPGIDASWFRWLRGFCRDGMGAMARHAIACEPLAAIYPAEAFSEVSIRLKRRQLSLQSLAWELAARGRLALVPLPASEMERAASVNTPSQAASL